jgi:hypothetical protein
MMRIMLYLMLALGGCSAAKVRCDAHLQPINAPAQKSAAIDSGAQVERSGP